MHYSVLVIGDNPEDLLAPYDTGLIVEEYELGPVHDSDKLRFMEYYGLISEGEEFSEDKFEKAYKKYEKEWNAKLWRKNKEVFGLSILQPILMENGIGMN